MGQKVHPIGFRVGITKRHQSQWFARFTKYSYTQSLLEDRLLRHTIMNFAKESLAKTLGNKKEMPGKEKFINPLVTHITIERGLIPYEISIQIHSENCEKFKLSLNNLKFNKELLCKLQKTRRFLMTASLNERKKQQDNSKALSSVSTSLNSLTDNTLVNPKNDLLEFSAISSTKKANTFSGIKNNVPSSNKVQKESLNEKKALFKASGLKLFCFTCIPPTRKFNKTKNWKKRKRPVFLNLLAQKKQLLKRLEKRQEIRVRLKRLMLKGLFFKKKGALISNSSSLFFSFLLRTKKEIKTAMASGLNKNIQSQEGGGFLEKSSSKDKEAVYEGQAFISPFSYVAKKAIKSNSNVESSSFVSSTLMSNIKLRLKKKFISIFLNKINKRFLKQLKEEISNWNKSLKEHRQEQLNQYGALRFAPIGYNKKWSLKRLNLLKTKPLFKIYKLIKFIEQNSLAKLDSLRKSFIAYGAISKTETLNYYQIINFLKHLKAMFLKFKKEQQSGLIFSGYASNYQKKPDFSVIKKSHSSNFSMPNASNSQTQANEIGRSGYFASEGFKSASSSPVDLTNECRKIHFIEYLQEMVQNYRTQNLFYFLSTIAEARKNLKKIKEFTKLHSKFLFGFSSDDFARSLDSTTNEFQKNNIFLNQIKNTIQFSGKKAIPSLKETYLEQLEQQRLMHQQLVQLKPKISIKFYAVNPQKAEIKAVNIAHSIIDALEKRKAFRKAIKDGKEKLMQNVNVKGVKIQVAGRLNGAEIARTEWVRSGRVPLQTLRANLDYSYKTAQTIYGIIGVKVWIFKGYTKLI